ALDALDPVQAVDGREEEVLDTVDEPERRVDLLVGAGYRRAVVVELVLAGRDDERQPPDQQRHEREDRERAREAELPALLGRRALGRLLSRAVGRRRRAVVGIFSHWNCPP